MRGALVTRCIGPGFAHRADALDEEVAALLQRGD